jgi:hypothetical protein
MMQIITYVNETAPAGYQAVALIINQFGDLHPVLIRGATENEARQKAETFWDVERVRFSKIDGRSKAGRALKAAQSVQEPPEQEAA